MKKNYLILAAIIASIGLASCSNEEYVGEFEGGTTGERAITFNLLTPAMTRPEISGSAAATALNNQFIIWGEKNEVNTGDGKNVTTDPGASGRDGDLVFENYIVRWTDNSAFTTTSNTKNWEYVGYKFNDTSADPSTANYVTNITPNTKPAEGEPIVQTIKYWDFNASSYTFTAVSALPADISGNKVKITKITHGDNVYEKGYNIELKSGASLDKIFISDRNNITSDGAGTDRTAVNKYGGNVTMKFRNFMSKIRFGVYETIPGYKVKITKVYYNSTYSTTNFGVDGTFLVAGDNTAYTVSYYSADNKATVAVKSGTTPDNQPYFQTAPVPSGDVTVTVPILTVDNIGETATTATYNKSETVTATSTVDNKAYTTVLPFPTNTTSIKVKMDLQLISEDTNETINMTEATAEIPAAYCQWLPNYAYTYILKINDNTDGHMGSFVGLYPITFDAVEVTDENGKAEYITTVSEPSITTLGVKGTAYSVDQNEYASGTNVYATVVDNHAVVALTKSSNIWLYTVTGTGITEATVAERLIEAPTMNAAQITLANAKTNPTDVTTANLTIQNTVPMEDNVANNKTVGTNMVATFTTAATTKYAIVYQKSDGAPTYVWGTGSTYADQDALTAAKTAAVDGKLYTDDQCTSEANYTWSSAETVYYTANVAKYASDGDFTAAGQVFAAPGSVATPAASRADENTPYYKPIKVKSKGTVVVKVVNCP